MHGKPCLYRNSLVSDLRDAPDRVLKEGISGPLSDQPCSPSIDILAPPGPALAPLTCVPFWGSPLGTGPSRGGSSGFVLWERGVEGSVRRAGTRPKEGSRTKMGAGRGESRVLKKSRSTRGEQENGHGFGKWKKTCRSGRCLGLYGVGGGGVWIGSSPWAGRPPAGSQRRQPAGGPEVGRALREGRPCTAVERRALVQAGGGGAAHVWSAHQSSGLHPKIPQGALPGSRLLLLKLKTGFPNSQGHTHCCIHAHTHHTTHTHTHIMPEKAFHLSWIFLKLGKRREE